MKAKALYDCTADDEGELSFIEGDIIVDVTESKEDGWFEGRVQGTSVRGLFPFNYAEFIEEQQQQSLIPSKTTPLNNSSSETSATTLFSSSVSPPNSTFSSTWSVISNKDSSLSSQDNHNDTAPADILNPSFLSRASTDKGPDAFDRVMAMQQPITINKPLAGTTVVSKLAGLDNMQQPQQQKPSIAPKPTQLLKKKPSIGSKKPTSTNTLATERFLTQPPLIPLSNSASPSVASRVRSLSISASATSSGPENAAPVKLPSLYNKPNSTNTIPLLMKTAATPAAVDIDNSNNNNKPDNNNISRKAMPIIQPKPYTNSIKSTTATHNNRPMLKQPERVIFDNNPVNENEEDVEDVDGYQLVRPSQIRQRQGQGSAMITPKAMPTLARVNLKQAANNNVVSSKPYNNLSSSSSSSSLSSLPSKPVFSALPSSSPSGSASSPSLNKDNKTKLDGIPGASNPAPRLPSRPVSKAGRRSRSSKAISTAVKSSPEPVVTTSSTKLPPPGPKPKPSQFSVVASDAVITASNSPSQRSKGRSISNPPPIQPKPFISKSNNNNTNNSKPHIPPTQNKPEGIIKKRPLGAIHAPTTTASKTTHPIPARPTTIERDQQWQQQQQQQQSNNSNDNTEDTNVKPSEILMRTRSKSNGWTQPTSKYNSNVPVLPARNITPRTEATAAAKKTPPPPPPSRPVQRQQNVPAASGVPVQYEELFNAIHDEGYVDGQTAKLIWQRSKVEDELLAKIWQHCDPQGSGLLDKNAFIQGMREIDTLLGSST